MSDQFDTLKKFLMEQMTMSHVYQPVMVRELLRRSGSASIAQIAQAILDRDPTQIDYFSEIVKNMVGRVLTKNRSLTEKKGEHYHLLRSNELTQTERQTLIAICDEKIAAFEAKRGSTIWEHRRRGHRPISGSVRYQVLSRAKFRCELCGISADAKSIEVDHIVPKSLGGKDDIANYQALCYSCNASKLNRDSVDHRSNKTLYDDRAKGCLFCDIPTADKARLINENTLAYSIRDGYPVTRGHTLIIPKRHSLDYFSLTQAEVNAINALLNQERERLQSADKTIEGFNIGMNCGEVAGQTQFHCHVHLIPRRSGDVANPRGGVRHVISGKGFYSGSPARHETL